MPQPFSFYPRLEAPGVHIESSQLGMPMSVASGGFATIWRAGINGQYAIKCFNDGGMAAAKEEYETLMMLSGSHVVPQAYALGTFVDGAENGSAAIIQEYVDGFTLANVLRKGLLTGSARQSVLSVADTLRIGLEVARALVRLREAGVSHRDLSANNVMLSRECVNQQLAGGANVWLIDFGQSTPVMRPSVTPSFKARLATVPYGAPEMYGGEYWELRNSAKCDIWSFGALLVTMLVGEYWPDEILDLSSGISSAKDLSRICQAKRKPLDLVTLMTSVGRKPSELELRIADVVRRCTQFDPRQRPTAPELLELMARLAPREVVRTPQRPPNAHVQDTIRAKPRSEAPRQYVATPVPTGNVMREGSPALNNRRTRMVGPQPMGQARAPEVRRQTRATNQTYTTSSFVVDGGTLRRYTGQERKVSIPEGLVAIGPGAFKNCTFVERVFVPDSVKIIGEYAFEGCSSLCGIAISSVKLLGKGAFWKCEALSSIAVREPVTEIPPYTFRECSSLQSVQLPSGLRSIGTEAFAGCRSLTHVEIPPSVETVGDRAFYGCISLGRIDTPASLKSEGEDAFVTGARGAVSVTTSNLALYRRIIIVAFVVVLLLLLLISRFTSA